MGRVDVRCSFCGKTPDKVRRLVAGPGVFICDNCIRLCNEIINERPTAGAPTASSWALRRERETKPRWWRRIFRTEVTAPA